MSNIVGIEYNRVTNTTSTDFPGFSKDAENRWNENSQKGLQVNISSLDTQRGRNFDLINIDTSLRMPFVV
ncbi:CGH_3_collapsed_G0000800.mRNA.1.CDS.1 [Saccharomyces cerevisiae]|nr:CGH_3_collapsed_G0000800.mRNA.1.CDS.1 [Saccharomyces cerevisiae]